MQSSGAGTSKARLDMKSLHDLSDLFHKTNIQRMHDDMAKGRGDFKPEDNFTLMMELRYVAYFLIKTLKKFNPEDSLKVTADKAVQIDAQLVDAKTFAFHTDPSLNYLILIIKGYIDLDKLAVQHTAMQLQGDVAKIAYLTVFNVASRTLVYCGDALSKLLAKKKINYLTALENRTLAAAHRNYFSRFVFPYISENHFLNLTKIKQAENKLSNKATVQEIAKFYGDIVCAYVCLYQILNVEFNNALTQHAFTVLDPSVLASVPFEVPAATQSWNDKYNFEISPTTMWATYLDIPRLKAQVQKILLKDEHFKQSFVEDIGQEIQLVVLTLGNLIKVVQENNKLDAIDREFLDVPPPLPQKSAEIDKTPTKPKPQVMAMQKPVKEDTQGASALEMKKSLEAIESSPTPFVEIQAFDELPWVYNLARIREMHATLTTYDPSIPLEENLTVLVELRFATLCLIKLLPEENEYSYLAQQVVTINGKAGQLSGTQVWDYKFDSTEENYHEEDIVRTYTFLHEFAAKSKDELAKLSHSLFAALHYFARLLMNFGIPEIPEVYSDELALIQHQSYFHRFTFPKIQAQELIAQRLLSEDLANLDTVAKMQEFLTQLLSEMRSQDKYKNVSEISFALKSQLYKLQQRVLLNSVERDILPQLRLAYLENFAEIRESKIEIAMDFLICSIAGSNINTLEKLPPYFNQKALQETYALMIQDNLITEEQANHILFSELTMASLLLFKVLRPLVALENKYIYASELYSILSQTSAKTSPSYVNIHTIAKGKVCEIVANSPVFYEEPVARHYLDLGVFVKAVTAVKGDRNASNIFLWELISTATYLNTKCDELVKNSQRFVDYHPQENLPFKTMQFFARLVRPAIFNDLSFMVNEVVLVTENSIKSLMLAPKPTHVVLSSIKNYFTDLQIAHIAVYKILNHALNNKMAEYDFSCLTQQQLDLVALDLPERKDKSQFEPHSYVFGPEVNASYINNDKINGLLSDIASQGMTETAPIEIYFGMRIKMIVNLLEQQIYWLDKRLAPPPYMSVSIDHNPKPIIFPRAAIFVVDGKVEDLWTKYNRPLINSIDSLPAIFNKTAIVEMHNKMKTGGQITSNAVLMKELHFVMQFLFKQLQPMLPDGIASKPALRDLYKDAESTIKIKWYIVKNYYGSEVIHWEVDQENFNQQAILSTYLNLEEILLRIHGVCKVTANRKEERRNLIFDVFDSWAYFADCTKLAKINDTPAVPAADSSYILQHLKYFNRFWREKIYHPDNFLFANMHASVENAVFKDSLANKTQEAKSALYSYYRDLQLAFIILYKIVNREVDNILVETPFTRLMPVHDTWLKSDLPPRATPTAYVDYDVPPESKHFSRYIDLKKFNATLANLFYQAHETEKKAKAIEFAMQFAIQVKSFISGLGYQMHYLQKSLAPPSILEESNRVESVATTTKSKQSKVATASDIVKTIGKQCRNNTMIADQIRRSAAAQIKKLPQDQLLDLVDGGAEAFLQILNNADKAQWQTYLQPKRAATFMDIMLTTDQTCLVNLIIKLREDSSRIKKFVGNYTAAKLAELNAKLPPEYQVHKGHGQRPKAVTPEILPESAPQPSTTAVKDNKKSPEKKDQPTAAEIFEKKRAAMESHAENLSLKITTLETYYKTTTQTTEITQLLADEILQPFKASKIAVMQCKYPDEAQLSEIAIGLADIEKKIATAQTQIRAVANIKQSISELTSETQQLSAHYKGISHRTILNDERYEDLNTKVTLLHDEIDSRVHKPLATGTQELADAVYSAAAIQKATTVIEKIKLELRPFRNRIKTLATQITKEERNWKPLPAAPVVAASSNSTDAAEAKAQPSEAPKQKIKKKKSLVVATPPVQPIPSLSKPIKIEILEKGRGATEDLLQPIKKYYTHLQVALEFNKFEANAELTHYAVLHNLFACYKALQKYLEHGFKPLDDIDINLSQIILAFGAHAGASGEQQLANFVRKLKMDAMPDRESIKAMYAEVKKFLTQEFAACQEFKNDLGSLNAYITKIKTIAKLLNAQCTEFDKSIYIAEQPPHLDALLLLTAICAEMGKKITPPDEIKVFLNFCQDATTKAGDLNFFIALETALASLPSPKAQQVTPSSVAEQLMAQYDNSASMFHFGLFGIGRNAGVVTTSRATQPTPRPGGRGNSE